LPGFTAESSLSKKDEIYQMLGIRFSSKENVIPSAPPCRIVDGTATCVMSVTLECMIRIIVSAGVSTAMISAKEAIAILGMDIEFNIIFINSMIL
jgi:hypothetical protein